MTQDPNQSLFIFWIFHLLNITNTIWYKHLQKLFGQLILIGDQVVDNLHGVNISGMRTQSINVPLGMLGAEQLEQDPWGQPLVLVDNQHELLGVNVADHVAGLAVHLGQDHVDVFVFDGFLAGVGDQFEQHVFVDDGQFVVGVPLLLARQFGVADLEFLEDVVALGDCRRDWPH